ncbi:hypothetical protein EHS25_007122 [Saitozyma podzolica]|uniref:Zn(2)-C6 fungal-type domain-containing protein n=1 Tax=Saitozyma podzolica TaxID=1890683 RepID=A0A427XPM5_9TREE|nr:hypothetical protein EHS25_007122 [Saitozyma podzolica]
MSHPHLQSPLTARKKGKARGPGQALRRGDACLMCRAKKLKCSATKPVCSECAKRNDRAGIDPYDHINNFFAFQQQQPSPASPFPVLPIQEWPLALDTSAVPGLLNNAADIHPGRMPGSLLSGSVDVSMWDTAKVDQAHPGSSTNSSSGTGAGSEFDANVFTLGVDPPLPDPFAHIARAAAVTAPITMSGNDPTLDEKSISPSAQNYLYIVSASSSSDHVVRPLADTLYAIAVVQLEEAMSQDLSYAGPSSTTYLYSPHPLHFQLHAVPSPIPPSLLQRTASSSSSTSSPVRGAKHSTSYFYAHAHAPLHSPSAPATPPLWYSRESSSSTFTSSSVPSPAMPSTPLIHPVSDTEVPELSFPLTPPSTPTLEQIPLHPELKQPIPTTAFIFLYPSSTGLSMPPPPPPTPAMPLRPALKRGDPPRSFMPTVAAFTSRSVSSYPVPTRSLTPPT